MELFQDVASEEEFAGIAGLQPGSPQTAKLKEHLMSEAMDGLMDEMDVRVLVDNFLVNDETVFKFTWRVGGRPDWMSSIEAYKGSTKRSPYVALAARA